MTVKRESRSSRLASPHRLIDAPFVADIVATRARRHSQSMHGPDDSIVQADVHIIDVEPPIRRTLELPLSLNLAQLHEVLQASFGWTDSHLHHFDIGGLVYGAPEFDEDGFFDHQTFEANNVRLSDFLFSREEPIVLFYEYDYGDGWIHCIELTRRPRQDGVDYPRCVSGCRAGPPEDVGGPFGYGNFLEAWNDPTHEEHEAYRRWAGRAFNPEKFDLDAINKNISRALQRSRGGYRFRLEP